MGKISRILALTSMLGGYNINRLKYPNGKLSYMNLSGINLVKEYELIKEKKSKLPYAKRNYIASIFETTNNMK